MATFLRRKLGKVLEKDTTPAILTVRTHCMRHIELYET